jgi:hypothetical protein
MSSTNYNLWIKQIDDYIYNLIDIHLDDLPDNTFKLDFDDGVSIIEMANKVVKDTEWEDYYYTMKNKKNLVN